ncbi:MAG TPA: hypothetical protein V6C89_19000 [Drouetiella sp.]|jgi:hypothetical protein
MTWEYFSASRLNPEINHSQDKDFAWADLYKEMYASHPTAVNVAEVGLGLVALAGACRAVRGVDAGIKAAQSASILNDINDTGASIRAMAVGRGAGTEMRYLSQPNAGGVLLRDLSGEQLDAEHRVLTSTLTPTARALARDSGAANDATAVLRRIGEHSLAADLNRTYERGMAFLNMGHHDLAVRDFDHWIQTNSANILHEFPALRSRSSQINAMERTGDLLTARGAALYRMGRYADAWTSMKAADTNLFFQEGVGGWESRPMTQALNQGIFQTRAYRAAELTDSISSEMAELVKRNNSKLALQSLVSSVSAS